MSEELTNLLLDSISGKLDEIIKLLKELRNALLKEVRQNGCP